MKTILDRVIGKAKIVNEKKLIGPRGGCGWTKKTLSDNRVVFIGPDTHGRIPVWIMGMAPVGTKIFRAGGTTYHWSGWITNQKGG